MTLDFTTEELNALIGLLDIATKAGGLQVAQAALPIAVKVQTAVNEANKGESNG
jgi:hypothetical protein